MEADIEAFLDYLARQKSYSPHTLSAYKGDLKQLADYFKGDDLPGDFEPRGEIIVDATLLSGYLQSLKQKKYISSTMARKIAAAKSFLRFMVERGRLREDLAPKLASPHVIKPVPKPLSVSEVRRLLMEPAKLSTAEAKRDKAMLELLYATGLRASELMALNVQDIDMEVGNVRCLRGRSAGRVVPIDQKIQQVVREYMDGARIELLSDEQENALFLNQRGKRLTRQGFWQIIQGYADRAGLSAKVTPRSLRHSFAVHKLKGGADLQSVQELLGHGHISTTRAYRQAEVHR